MNRVTGKHIPPRHYVPMRELVEVGDPIVAITFADPQRSSNGEVEQLDVSIRDLDLTARKSVNGSYADGFERLADFFDDLAAYWRGWNGERKYETTEHDLRLVATHDGHVHLRVRLRQSGDPDGWTVETVVRLESGEQLTRVAAAVSALARRSGRQR